MAPALSRRRTLCLLGACALPHAAAAPEPRPVDLMPAFWAAYDGGLGRPLAERVQRLAAGFFDPHLADYRTAGIAKRLANVAPWLPEFDAVAADVRAVHARFVRDYAGRMATFRRALPDFDAAAAPVTLMPSLFGFDGHLEPDGKAVPLFFGLDGIVRFHGADANLDVLFTHELFHCYQAQKNPALMLDPKAPVFASLWQEGVATYASEQLNPGAGLLHVLLDDKPVAEADRATLRRVAAALLEHLDATDAGMQEAFFGMGYAGSWPARSGYHVGLLLARRVGATTTLPRMAALPTPEVRATLAKALRALQDETAPA